MSCKPTWGTSARISESKLQSRQEGHFQPSSANTSSCAFPTSSISTKMGRRSAPARVKAQKTASGIPTGREVGQDFDLQQFSTCTSDSPSLVRQCHAHTSSPHYHTVPFPTSSTDLVDSPTRHQTRIASSRRGRRDAHWLLHHPRLISGPHQNFVCASTEGGHENGLAIEEEARAIVLLDRISSAA